jgi:pantoate--beta-alanine ligase
MLLITDIDSLRQFRNSCPPEARIGLVPTMGALHAGHLALAARAVQENEVSIVTIFVNPTQFGPSEDFSRYPRTLEADLAKLAPLGIDAVFAPEVASIYPEPPAEFAFQIRSLDRKLCGASRPGHMNGVVQVVSILFHLTRPTHAYFGLKDYQQCLIIRRLVRELHFPLEVVPCPIVREADGLAMSSRNVYLSPEERRQAAALSRTLREVRERLGTFSGTAEAKAFARQALAAFPLVQPDYVEILHGETLEDLDSLAPEGQPVAFIAAWLGKTRLIDNLPLY